MDEEANVEPIIQFSNVTYSVLLGPIEYTDEPANTEYVDYTFSTFRDTDLNISFTSNTMNVAKEIVPVNIANVGDPPELVDFFQFTFSGSFGEEIETAGEYTVRSGNDILQLNSYYDLPDFTEKDTYLIKYAPDSRHSVNVAAIAVSNAVPATTVTLVTREIELEPSRHVTRVTQIRLTIDVRAAEEKEERMKTIQDLLNRAKNVSGL